MKIFFLGLLFLSTTTHARMSSFAVSEDLRDLIELRYTPLDLASSIVLPVSRGFDQGDSNLCWIFSTLNSLETNYLVKHPNSKIELSRGAMQYYAMQDRLKILISGKEDNMSEGGLEIEALRLLKENGAVSFKDYHDFAAWDVDGIRQSIERAPEASRLKVLKTEMDKQFSALPGETHLEGKLLKPSDLAKILLSEESVELYASENKKGWFPETDPDARFDTRVYYTKKKNLITAMKNSLLAGLAFTWGTENHAMMIYGADFDQNGDAVSYHVKNSYEPFTYKALASTVHLTMVEVTVAKKFLPKDD